MLESGEDLPLERMLLSQVKQEREEPDPFTICTDGSGQPQNPPAFHLSLVEMQVHCVGETSGVVA